MVQDVHNICREFRNVPDFCARRYASCYTVIIPECLMVIRRLGSSNIGVCDRRALNMDGLFNRRKPISAGETLYFRRIESK